ncbi:MAG TPA: type I polyketide synthase, partial [Lentzea sp.]
LSAVEHPLLGAAVSVAGSEDVLFTSRLSARSHPWLSDHAVGGRILLPGTAFVELAVRAGDEVGCEKLDELTISAPLVLDGSVQLQVAVRGGDERRAVAIYSRTEDDAPWIEHASGTLSTGSTASDFDATTWPPRAESVDVEGAYERFADMGFEYGPAFQGLRAVWRDGDDVYAEVTTTEDTAGFGLHPALLDSALHAALLAKDGAGLPFSWEGVSLHATGATELRVRLRSHGDAMEIALADTTGQPVATVESLVVRPVAVPQHEIDRDSLFRIEWTPLALPSEAAGNVVVEHVVGDGNVIESTRALTSRVLAKLQEWIAAERAERLAFVTREGDLAGQAVWGLVRSAQTEHPGRFVLVDIDDDAVLPQALAADEPQLRVRRGQVLAPRLTRAAGSQEVVWESPVLITGGGGLGGVIAQHLVAEHGVTELIVASRSGKKPDWEVDASVKVVKCDVSDRKALQRLLKKHTVKSVVHTAGVLDDGVIESLTPEQFDTVMRPKVDAAWHLHELLPEARIVLFSSAAGILGGAGQGNYAAANAFLDALAQHRPNTVSLAWGTWEATVGLTGSLTEADRERLVRAGMPPITPAQGTALFDAAVASGEAVLLPARLDLATLRTAEVPSLLRGLIRTRARRTVAGSDAATGLAAKLRPLGAVERLDALLDLIRAQVSAVLALENFDAGRAFRDLGFDSLTAVDLRNRLTAVTGLRLPATLVFDYPTAHVLATFLRDELFGAEDVVVATRTVSDDDPIVVVGMACRFPGGVSTPEDLWQLVLDGTDAISEFPSDRGWDLDSLFSGNDIGTSATRLGGFLHDAGEFDPAFFGMSPREALATDSQQRLLLETAWEAFERAGIDPVSLRGSDTGVFAGVMYNDYAQLLGGEFEGHHGTGSSPSVASGRVSYVLGLEGPAVTIDTACSSSLVAMHLAVQSLRTGESSLALAGGVAVMSTPATFIEISRQRGVSSDGRCKAFSEGADGTGFSEGAGLLVLERQSDAVRHGHNILAVLRGSAVNQDGASNGLTAPNGPSQQRVIRAALASAGLSPADVDAVEAHGTGTSLGDPIEAQALLAVYGQERAEPLYLGSIKSNIGHTQSAAGVAGVIKMIMALRHGVLPQTLHVSAPSSHIEWDAGAVELLTSSRDWPALDRPRRAGVSSFGISGTNAHVILEAPELSDLPEMMGMGGGSPQGAGQSGSILQAGAVPLAVSAKSAEALRAQVERIKALTESGVPANDIGFSLAARSRFDQRAVIIGDEVVEGAVLEAGPGPVFVFPGQGSQWHGMAVKLLDEDETFARWMAEADRAIEQHVGWSVIDTLRGDAELLERIEILQPALFAIMISLAQTWRANGVEPAAVVGHSQGEIAAAYIAGALSLDQAAAIVVKRSQLFADELVGNGAVASIALPANEVQKLLPDELAIAGVNSPHACTVAGAVPALEAFVESCVAKDIRARVIGSTVASHCAQVDRLRDQILELFADITPQSSTIPFYSTVTAERIDTANLDAEYWFQNARQPVSFAKVVEKLTQDGHRVLIESSAHPVLMLPAQQTAEAANTEIVAIGSLRRDQGDKQRFTTSLAEAWVAGLPVRWQYPGGRTVPLPTYPFDRQRFWPEPLVKDTSDPVDAEFWELVDNGGLEDIGVEREVAHTLAQWRSRRKSESTMDSWRYRDQWTPVTL